MGSKNLVCRSFRQQDELEHFLQSEKMARVFWVELARIDMCQLGFLWRGSIVGNVTAVPFVARNASQVTPFEEKKNIVCVLRNGEPHSKTWFMFRKRLLFIVISNDF